MLIYGCLAAVTWCRCANVTKVYTYMCSPAASAQLCGECLISAFIQRQRYTRDCVCAIHIWFQLSLLAIYGHEIEARNCEACSRLLFFFCSHSKLVVIIFTSFLFYLFQIVINFSTFPIRSTKYVSPCDDGYIYIPVS